MAFRTSIAMKVHNELKFKGVGIFTKIIIDAWSSNIHVWLNIKNELYQNPIYRKFYRFYSNFDTFPYSWKNYSE